MSSTSLILQLKKPYQGNEKVTHSGLQCKDITNIDLPMSYCHLNEATRSGNGALSGFNPCFILTLVWATAGHTTYIEIVVSDVCVYSSSATSLHV